MNSKEPGTEGTSRADFEISVDVEFEAYIAAFTASSRRARWAIIAVTIISLLIFGGYQNSKTNSWIHSRVEHTQDVLTNWEETGQIADEDKEWAAARGIRDEEDIKHWIQELRAHYRENVLLLRAPFLGIVFDVNDLGLLGGITLMILMLVLLICMAKQHENLFLGLWKIREVSKTEKRKWEGSVANVLYHAMAMVEVFSNPPTLARWGGRKLRWLYLTAFLIPFAIQARMFFHDMGSFHIALLYSKKQAFFGLAVHVIVLASLLVLTCLCIVYARASDLRWRSTFAIINPDRKNQEPVLWRKWVRLKRGGWWSLIFVITVGVLTILAIAVDKVYRAVL